jgi:hypothetical protein
MILRIATFIENLSRLWCKFAHSSVMWPIHGHYRCRTCLRLYAVPWERGAARQTEPVHAPVDISVWKKAA